MGTCGKGINTLENDILQDKIKNALCNINYDNVFYGIGFFCKIPFPNNSNLLTVLITNYNILGDVINNKRKNINISLINNNNNSNTIFIDESRLIYVNKNIYDISIIEIKDKDGFDFNTFLEIDDENSDIQYKNKEVYIINNINSHIVNYYKSEINYINSDNHNLGYLFKKEVGLLGTPIINYNNYKVIGIHKWNQNINNKPSGTLIMGPIKDFINIIKQLNKKKLDNAKNKKIIKRDFTLFNSMNCIFNNSINEKIRKRLVKEINDTKYEEGYEIHCLIDNKIFGILEGPPETIYEDGYFKFNIIYSDNYPFKPPDFYFTTKIFHPNINENGYVNVDILKDKWIPELSLKTIIISIQSLLNDPNIDDFENEEAVKLFRKSRKEYENTVRFYISIYSNYSNINNEFLI